MQWRIGIARDLSGPFNCNPGWVASSPIVEFFGRVWIAREFYHHGNRE
jgi:hypothetical protein